MDEKVALLDQWIHESKRIVFLGGAGVSTESGIPDFRSADGVYAGRQEYPPEVMLSHSFFVQHPDLFYSFYRDKMLYLSAQPNAAHKKLAALEAAGKLAAVVTQNIDGLHQKGGSKNVIELHGSVHRNYCMECSKQYDVLYIAQSSGVPKCACGGTIRPDVVLYEEMLDDDAITGAINAISNAGLFIVGGTSLNVYPAAGLINYYNGNKLVLINKQPTTFDAQANLLIEGKIGEVFEQIESF